MASRACAWAASSGRYVAATRIVSAPRSSRQRAPAHQGRQFGQAGPVRLHLDHLHPDAPLGRRHRVRDHSGVTWAP
ncbi:hypothetical protein [Streptomyces sp. NPDC088755]|uniref:hypothetical protein n=1 Tax=Streptomyces sp. NPDC088755 TaxID=3365888 RepID=UPI003817E343